MTIKNIPERSGQQKQLEQVYLSAMQIYQNCNYKEKCFGNMSWCDGKFRTLCRTIQSQK